MAHTSLLALPAVSGRARDAGSGPCTGAAGQAVVGDPEAVRVAAGTLLYSLGAGMARAFGAMRERVPGDGGGSVTRGVKVEVGERQAAVDLDVVVEYGVSIVDVAGDVRTGVISALERMTDLEVVEVNIAVDDVHLPDEEEEAQPDEGRVR
ncbi:Asp23/Gls24 family envelope stress response protein [Streptomyces adustus]